jgi:hypothetical protein
MEIAALAACVGLFVVLTTYRLDTPALIWDSLMDEYSASRWAQPLRDLKWPPPEFYLGSPLYHGRLTSYLMLPLFLLGGPSYALVKAWPVLFGVLTVLLTWLFARNAFGRRTALLTVMLLVIHPSFVGGIRIGNMQASYMLVFSVGSLYFLMQWWIHGRTRDLLSAFFLLGLGLATRIWFLWYAAAIFATGLVFRREVVHRLQARGNAAEAVVDAAAAFGVGAMPVLSYEFRSNFASLKRLAEGHAADGLGATLVRNLAGAWRNVSGMLSGDWISRTQFGSFGNFPRNEAYVWIGLAAVLVLLAAQPADPFRRRARGVMAVFGFILCASLTTPASRNLLEGTFFHYFFIIYPLPQILIALAATRAFSLWPRRAILPALAVGVLFLAEIRTLAYYVHQVQTLGGRGSYSQATRDLSRWLADRSSEADAVVVANEHLMANLYFWNPSLSFLSLSRLGWDSVYESGPRPDIVRWQAELRARGFAGSPTRAVEEKILLNLEQEFFPRWENELASRNSRVLYLVRYNDHHSLEWPMDLVISWGACRNRFLQLRKRFFEADGRPAYEVYVMKPHEPADPSPFRRFDPNRMAF